MVVIKECSTSFLPMSRSPHCLELLEYLFGYESGVGGSECLRANPYTQVPRPLGVYWGPQRAHQTL